jgi:lambda family phage portal protein
VIGPSIRVKPQSSDAAWNKLAAAAWKKWTRGKVADVRHMHTWGAIQQLAYRGKLRDGDCGVLLTEEQDGQGRKHPRVQIVEGEHIDLPSGAGYGTDVVDGVELGENNEPVAFHLLTVGDDGSLDASPIRSRDFVFLCRPPLYSSVRGESAFNGSWTLFDQIVGYLEATTVSARVGAMQAGILTKKNPTQTLRGLQPLGGQGGGPGDGPRVMPMEPGVIHVIGEGEDFKGFNPTQPTQNFPDAIAAFARFVGLRFGLTIEQVLLDFSRTSYSSARAARLQALTTAQKEQEDFAATFLARVYPWVVAKLVKAGLLPAPPADGTGYEFEWIPQARPWIDPTKDIAAAQAGISLGIDARTYVAMEQGYDFDDLCEVNKSDVAKLFEAGLSTDPRGGPPAYVTILDQAGQPVNVAVTPSAA